MDLFRKKTAATLTTIGTPLARCLSRFDLILMGIGAIVGAGIFVITGIVAATKAGPAIVLSYLIAGFTCAFAALSYAELATTIGGCGSAYGYTYIGFGEFIAWIVGWDLLLEYSISVSTIAVGWSSYFVDFLHALNINLPIIFLKSPANSYCNINAALIIIFLGILLISGIKHSARFNNTIVIIKLSVIFLFIAIAVTAVEPINWSPFMPFGWHGVIQGAALIFFAYIGFDAVSTAAEETVNPQRDLPIGIIGSLVICAGIYILVSGLLTAIVPYKNLNVASPISHALLAIGYKFAAGFIGAGALAGLTSVMLVWFYGLTRIFFAMARDGLLPKFFANISPITKSPTRIISLCGVIMSIVAAIVPMSDLAQLVNIGTLFAFIIVCGGVIILRYRHPNQPRVFKTPLMPLVPILGILSSTYLIMNLSWLTIMRFIIWMIIGLIIYFCYSRYHSILNT